MLSKSLGNQGQVLSRIFLYIVSDCVTDEDMQVFYYNLLICLLIYQPVLTLIYCYPSCCRVFLYKGFLSDKECDYLVSLVRCVSVCNGFYVGF